MLKSKWYFFILTLYICALFVRLGVWQLHRAEEKQSLQSAFNTHIHHSPLSLAELPHSNPSNDLLYSPVEVTGEYDNAHTLFLDNKLQNHQVGYEVLTPLKVPNNPNLVLINRGWIPGGPRRDILPRVPDIKGKQTVLGWIYLTPGKSFTLGQTIESENRWPLKLQALDISLIAARLHQPVYPFILLTSPEVLSTEEAPYFIRNWQFQLNELSPQKHIAYAVQWFTFAAVLIILFLILNRRKR